MAPGGIVMALAPVLLAGALASSETRPSLGRLGPAPNFALTTHQNDRIWLTQLRERIVVLTFGCTTCESCPEILPALGALERELGDLAGRRVFFVLVSLDPGRDTPSVLRQFARSRGLAPVAWLLLTGKPAEVAVVARRYGVRSPGAAGGLAHDCAVFLVDGLGVIRARYGPDRLAGLGDGLASLLEESPR